MMNNEIKLPAAYAAIDENEMVYLNGGSITDTQGWLIFMNVGLRSASAKKRMRFFAPKAAKIGLSDAGNQ